MKHLADTLLRHVYYSAIAVVSADREGAMLGVTLLDAEFGTEDPVIFPGARCVHLICNHYEGRMTLTREESENCRRIAAQAGAAAVHIYIYGEDIGFFEVDSKTVLGYNEENAV